MVLDALLEMSACCSLTSAWPTCERGSLFLNAGPRGPSYNSPAVWDSGTMTCKYGFCEYMSYGQTPPEGYMGD